MELKSQENASFFSKASNSVLVFLVLVALLLSYFLYQKATKSGSSSLGDTQTQNSPKGNETADNNDAVSKFPPLSDDERAVLNPPSGDVSQAENDAHFKLVEKTAVDSGELAIGPGCKVSPIVLKTKMGKELTFRNYDSVSHTIAMPKDKLSFIVPANKSILVPATFGKVAGTYGYICDQSALAGIVWVSE